MYAHDFIYFNEDGTINYGKPKSKENVKFTAISIGTQAKGPLYTMVKGMPDTLIRGFMNGYVSMYYGINDTPIDEEYQFDTSVNFIDGTSPYSFYPLVKQIMGAGEFLANQSNDDQFIFIDQIHVSSGCGDINLTGDFSEKKLAKRMEEICLKTDMSSIADDNSYLKIGISPIAPIKQKKSKKYESIKQYTFCDDPFNDGQYGQDLFVLFPEIESAYRVPGYLLNDLQILSNIRVDLTYEPSLMKCKTRSVTGSILKKRIEEMCVRSYGATTVDQIFKLCIYVPQLIMIERSLHNVDVSIDVTLESGGHTITLTISREEYKPTFSLYNVIHSLVGIFKYKF